jgi:hypothetical protein
MTRLLLTLLVSFVPLANADYASCILENMKGVGSELAAAEIKQACRLKWPSDKSTIVKSGSAKGIRTKPTVELQTQISAEPSEANAPVSIGLDHQEFKSTEPPKLSSKEDVAVCARYLMAPNAEIYSEALSELKVRKLAHKACDSILRDRATEELANIEADKRTAAQIEALWKSHTTGFKKLPKARTYSKNRLNEDKTRTFWIQVLRRLDEAKISSETNSD